MLLDYECALHRTSPSTPSLPRRQPSSAAASIRWLPALSGLSRLVCSLPAVDRRRSGRRLGRTLDPSRRAASASPCFDVALSLIQRPYRCHICPWTRRHSMITCSSYKSREDSKPSASLQCVRAHAHAHARCYIQHLPERPGRAIAAPVTRIRSTDKGR